MRRLSATESRIAIFRDCASHGDLARITERLIDEGWAEADISKVLGENFLRAVRDIWG